MSDDARRHKGSSGGSEFRHRAVADALRKRVSEGSFPGGSKLPALREIADEFAVSTMTVRQAIRTLEREGHIYTIAGVGAFVRPLPPPKSAPPRMLAFIAMDLTSAFDMSIARGVERACQSRGWAVQILDAHLDVQLETRNMLRLPQSGARGAIVLPPWDPENIDALFEIQSADFPLVLVDRTVPGFAADLVESDHEQGAYTGTRHLIQHGHRQILMVTHRPGASSVTARIRGYERALRDAGINPRPDWKAWITHAVQIAGLREGHRWKGGCHAVLPLLRELRPPVGVLAIDAYSCWGVYEACQQLGLRIPHDVSVVGFDDSEIAHAISPPTTILAQRTDDIGRAAVELLERRLNTRQRPDGSRKSFTHVVIEIDLVERQSVADAGTR